MKLRHRLGALFMVPVIMVVVMFSPFVKKVYAVALVDDVAILLALLAACGIGVSYALSDVVPKTDFFDPAVLDNPSLTHEERAAYLEEMKLHMAESPTNYGKVILGKVGEKIKPFTDKVKELASTFSLPAIALRLGMGVAELIDRAKTGTLELTKEQAVAMQKFMSENFAELTAGNISVLNGMRFDSRDSLKAVKFPAFSSSSVNTFYLTNITLNYYCSVTTLITNDVKKRYSASCSTFLPKDNKFVLSSTSGSYPYSPEDFGLKDFSNIFYRFESSASARNTNFFAGLTCILPDGVEYDFSYVGSNNSTKTLECDFVVSTDAPTLTATGSLQFPQTDIPLTLPNDLAGSLTGGLSIPVAQDMDGVIAKSLADAIARAGGIDVPGEIPPIPPVIPPEIPNFTLPGNIINKFPFSIPFDIVKGARLLVAPPVTPKFDINFAIPLPSVLSRKNIPVSFTIDLTPFDKIAAMCRTFSVLIFTVGLAVATPKLVKGAK